MFNKRLTFVSAMLAAALMTGCAERSAPYGEVDGSVTYIVKSEETDASCSGEPTEDDWAEVMCSDTKTVGYHELEKIPAGLTYGEILKTLGKTAAFGQSNYRQYLTFDRRLIQFHFDSMDDVCPYSGIELFNNALPLRKEKSFGHAIVTKDNSDLVTYFTQHYLTKENYLTCMRLIITDNTKIVFENGSRATADDLEKAGTAVRFETDGLELYSYPPQTVCTKAIIVELEPTVVEPPYDETLDDGSVKTHYPDGVTVTRLADGGVETYLPYIGGAVIEYTPPAPDNTEGLSKGQSLFFRIPKRSSAFFGEKYVNLSKNARNS